MSCFHPCFIQKFVNPYNSDDFECKFISSDYAKNILECREILEGKYQGSATVDDVYFSSCGGKLVQFIQIPCGKCIGCRIDYKRSWADRLTYHSFGKEDNSYFITLTYDEGHCPKRLKKVHLSNFIKRLRAAHPDITIRFFASSAASMAPS